MRMSRLSFLFFCAVHAFWDKEVSYRKTPFPWRDWGDKTQFVKTTPEQDAEANRIELRERFKLLGSKRLKRGKE